MAYKKLINRIKEGNECQHTKTRRPVSGMYFSTTAIGREKIKVNTCEPVGAMYAALGVESVSSQAVSKWEVPNVCKDEFKKEQLRACLMENSDKPINIF